MLRKAMTTDSLSYKDAGVDIDAGNTLVEKIKPIVKQTNRPGVIGGLGGFGGLFELPLDRYQNPLLVSGTDGVGTKLKLAIDLGIHDTIGIDLVAMCVNDILVAGAEPLFFLDYYATGKLELDVSVDIIKGIAEGCKQSGAALIGGETAEMPGMYQQGDYDLAGFSVGIVDKDKVLSGEKVQSGDIILGLASSGPHSNGYSLIRKVIERAEASLDEDFNGATLGKALLAPTRIYVKSLLQTVQAGKVNALCHITGGGLPENLPRVLPENTCAVIDTRSWQRPAVFDWLQQQGNIEESEMLRTFNCGIGMAVVVSPENQQAVTEACEQAGEKVFVIGKIEQEQNDNKVVFV